ncbi:MAG: hypothetical protein KAX49_00860 [Halanaerobiales bacterium]|nr:hypothetical protein [Halanaerobiales bacterium]
MIKKTFLAILILSIIIIPTVWAEQATTVESSSVKQEISYSIPENTIGIEGIIKEIRKDMDKVIVLVEGQRLNDEGYDQVKLVIHDDTQIINEKDNAELSYGDFKEGMVIKGFYGPAVTRSLPPMGVAKLVLVQERKIPEEIYTYGTIGQIREVKGGIMVDIINEAGENEINLVISDRTIITDQSGLELSKDELKEGLKIKASYGPAVTASLPPIGTANSVVVEEQKIPEEIYTYGTIGQIREVKGGIMIHIINDAGENEINLVISDRTVITDQSGLELSKDELKEGLKIKASYGPAVTMSLPPIGNADKIIIIAE